MFEFASPLECHSNPCSPESVDSQRESETEDPAVAAGA